MTERSQQGALAADERTFESGPPHGFCKHCGRSREVHVLVGAVFFCERPGTEAKFTDAQRLDWLEKAALRPNGILLHDGSKVRDVRVLVSRRHGEHSEMRSTTA